MLVRRQQAQHQQGKNNPQLLPAPSEACQLSSNWRSLCSNHSSNGCVQAFGTPGKRERTTEPPSSAPAAKLQNNNN